MNDSLHDANSVIKETMGSNNQNCLWSWKCPQLGHIPHLVCWQGATSGMRLPACVLHGISGWSISRLLIRLLALVQLLQDGTSQILPFGWVWKQQNCQEGFKMSVNSVVRHWAVSPVGSSLMEVLQTSCMFILCIFFAYLHWHWSQKVIYKFYVPLWIFYCGANLSCGCGSTYWRVCNCIGKDIARCFPKGKPGSSSGNGLW